MAGFFDSAQSDAKLRGMLSTPFHKYGHVSERGIRHHPGRAGTGAPPLHGEPKRICETHYLVPSPIGLVTGYQRLEDRQHLLAVDIHAP